MNLTIAKWGNSLAVRIPAEVARELSLKEGVVVECAATPTGTLELVPTDKKNRDKRLQAHFSRVNKRMAGQRMTTPSSQLLREEYRY